MTFDTAQKALRAAEKALAKTRVALDAARGEVEAHQSVVTELQDRKALEIRKAGAAGKLPNLSEINASIDAAKGKLADAQAVLSTLEQAEQDAIKALLTSEKQAQDALKTAWDEESDRLRAQLITVAGPLLKSYWLAKFRGHNPRPLYAMTRQAGGFIGELEGAAQDAEVEFDIQIPESIESALLTTEERTAGVFYPAMAI